MIRRSSPLGYHFTNNRYDATCCSIAGVPFEVTVAVVVVVVVDVVVVEIETVTFKRKVQIHSSSCWSPLLIIFHLKFIQDTREKRETRSSSNMLYPLRMSRRITK